MQRSFLIALFCVLCALDGYVKAADTPPVSLDGIHGDTEPYGWSSHGDAGASEVLNENDTSEEAQLRITLSADANDNAARSLHSPRHPVREGTVVTLAYSWSGDGLYDASDEVVKQKTYGWISVVFISDDNKYIDGLNKYYFESQDAGYDKIEITAPPGAATFAVRIGVARVGESLAAPADFTVGDFDLIVTENESDS